MFEGLTVIDHVDLQNAQVDGRVRLNTVGSLEWIEKLPGPLAKGEQVHLIDAELHVIGVVAGVAADGFRLVSVDWTTLVERSRDPDAGGA